MVVTFNGNSTTTAVSALINNITYEDTNTATPNEGALTVRFVLTDGDGGTSSAYDTTVTVVAVNDAPTIATNTGVTVTEGSTGTTITSAILNEGDPDDSGAGLTYTLTSAPASGTLKKSGVALTAGGSFTQADINSNLITYDHDGSETSSDSFGFSLADGGENGASPATGTFSITVAAVNDTAPVLISAISATVAENQTAVMTLTATDADLPAATLSYSVAGGVDAAWFVLNANTGVLTFVTAPNRVAPADAGADNQYDIDVQVSDGLNTTVQSLQVSVTDINETPVLGANSLSIAQGDSTVLGSAQLSATDPESAPATLVFSISALSNGQFELLSAPGVAIFSFSQAQLGAGDVQFVHDGSASAPAYAVSVGDGLLASSPVAASVSFAPTVAPAADPLLLPVPDVLPDSPGFNAPELAPATGEVTAGPAAGEGQAAAAAYPAAPAGGGQGSATSAPSLEETVLSARVDPQVARTTGRSPVTRLAQAPSSAEVQSGADLMQNNPWTWSGTSIALINRASGNQSMDFDLYGNNTPRAEEEFTLGARTSASLLGGLVAGFGTAWWAGRAGVLLGSLVAGTPVWARLDPLPIASPRDDDEEQENDVGDTNGGPPEALPRPTAASASPLHPGHPGVIV